GPNYRRPKVDVPAAYRGAPSLESVETQKGTSHQASPAASGAPQPSQTDDAMPQANDEQSLGDQRWWEVFQDPELQGLIRTALQNNYDVRIAATRILEAQAQLGITRADQLPTIGAGAAAVNQRVPKEKPVNQEFETSANSVGASIVWELDFWGKYRRST